MQSNNLRITILLLLALIGWLYFYTDGQAEHYQGSAEPAVEKIILDISSWQAADMRMHLSPAASQTMSDEQLQALLKHYRPLGKLKSVKELQFSRLISVFSLFGEQIIGYTGTASFENKQASFTISLIEQHGRFFIYNFNLSTD